MGQQQLLLVILVTILVGIATVVAINVFGSAAEQANRDAVRQDLIQASAAVQAIWARPIALGGVGGDLAADPPSDVAFNRLLGLPGTFDGITIENENALYSVARISDQVTITATPTTYQPTIVIRVQRNPSTAEDADAWIVELTDGALDPVFLSGGP